MYCYGRWEVEVKGGIIIKVVTHILVSTPPPPEAMQLCLPSHFSVAQGWGFLAGEGRVLWSVLSIWNPLLAGVRCWCLLFYLLCSRVHFGLFFQMLIHSYNFLFLYRFAASWYIWIYHIWCILHRLDAIFLLSFSSLTPVLSWATFL